MWKALLYQTVCVVTCFLLGYVAVRVLDALGAAAWIERLLR